MKIITKNKTRALAVHEGKPFMFAIHKNKPDARNTYVGCYIDESYERQLLTIDSPEFKTFVETWGNRFV